MDCKAWAWHRPTSSFKKWAVLNTFINNPDNSHNSSRKLDAGKDKCIIMDGGYTLRF